MIAPVHVSPALFCRMRCGGDRPHADTEAHKLSLADVRDFNSCDPSRLVADDGAAVPAQR